MTINGTVALVVVGLLALLFFSIQPPAPSVDGFVPISQAPTKIVWWKGPQAAESTIAVVDKSTAAVVAEFRRDRDGVLREDPQATGRYTVEARETPILGFGERLDQLGTFAGYFSQRQKQVDRFQVGLHYEPITLLFGTVGIPSVAITKDLAALGLTLRLPPRSFPRLSHLGVGLWEAAPFTGGSSGLLYGAEFHITLP